MWHGALAFSDDSLALAIGMVDWNEVIWKSAVSDGFVCQGSVNHLTVVIFCAESKPILLRAKPRAVAVALSSPG